VYDTIEKHKEEYKALILTNRNVSKIEVVGQLPTAKAVSLQLDVYNHPPQ